MIERFVVQVTDPDFGVPPYLFISIGGKRAGLPPWFNAKVGDVISIERRETDDAGRSDSNLRRRVEVDGP